MGWFYISWIIVSAVYVSCQELTTSLPEGNDACTRNEVNFTCTIRSSPNLTVLILSWSSVEYIGRGDTLQFTSDTMPGTNIPSLINENVTAILTNNATMDGVPVLVSELRIVNANQNSMIRCDSITNEGSNSTNFIVPVFPNSPQNVTARQVSRDCDLSLTWSPPANTDINGLTYKIYVPSQDIVIADVSNTNLEFNVINCRDDDVRVLVAAMNHFGCEGPNSSAVQIQPLPLEISTVPEAQLAPGAIAGIVVAVMVMVVLVVLVVVGCLVFQVVGAVKVNKQEKKQLLWIESYCVKVFDGLKWGAHPSELVQESVLQSLEEKNATDVQEGLIIFINRKLKSATNISFVLRRLKRMNLPVMSTFDVELESAGSSVTMDRLIEEANRGQRGELTRELKAHLEELTEKLRKADPERVKELLQKFINDLKNAEEEKGELWDVIDKLEQMKMKVDTSVEAVQDHLGKVIVLLKDERFIVEWTAAIQQFKESKPIPQSASKKGPKRKLLEKPIEMEPLHETVYTEA